MSNHDAYLLSLGPSAWWKLADSVGSLTAADSSGNGYTGTVNGGVTFGQAGPIAGSPQDTAALFASAANIQGPSIATASEAAFNLQATFSVVVWLRNTDASNLQNNGGIVSATNSVASTNGWGLYYEGVNGLYAYWTAPSGAWQRVGSFGQFVPNDSAWHMLTVTWNISAGTLQSTAFQLDGGAPNTGTVGYTGTATYLTAPEVVMGQGYYSWVGTIAEVAIFPTALTAAQVARLWSPPRVVRGNGGFPQLVAGR